MKPNKIKFPKEIPSISKEKDSNTLLESFYEFFNNYQNNTDKSLKKIDYLIIFLVFSACIQLLYCILSGSYPFNSFLSGFISTVGQFVLTVSLRGQFNIKDEENNENISPERAFGDFVFSSLILHFFVITFLG
ncbi:hypothetical protein PNEG_00395 [Pneumocystis murina B123]|uniref:Dolichyl-diphosphooligosaccharide--protein glycosyltransferase subunit OST2 n=1 Tax=Pneumocystis murina (strain B123) TaxID=1069680 RepID=M7NRK4_PNEMU|nr:hypothetical protein PNEG_00395 [Pneumocystis murina B123]EMR11368.1 hypothetical protein PNEG_00395 [Pneumocystis murina B123]